MKQQDRKELVRAYQETARPMGVYRVYSPRGDRAVVASSNNVASALNRQRAQLEMGFHPDKALQSEWDRLGAWSVSMAHASTTMHHHSRRPRLHHSPSRSGETEIFATGAPGRQAMHPHTDPRS